MSTPADSGEQPSPTATDAAETTDTAAVTTAEDTANSVSQAQETDEGSDEVSDSPEVGKPTDTLPASLDELLERLSPEQVEGLTNKDIDLLAAGDREAVARFFPQLTTDQPAPAATTAAPAKTSTTPPPAAAPEKAIDRISLRGLSAKDQREIADAVEAVRKGTFSTVTEAYTALHGTKPAAQPAKTEETTEETTETTAQEAPTSPEIEALQSGITALETELTAAEGGWDTAKIGRLNREIAKKEMTLQSLKDRAVAQAQAAREAQTTWATKEQESIAKVSASHKDLLDDNTPLAKAFKDQRDLATLRIETDPTMTQPNWAEVILERTLAIVKPASSTIAKPPPTTTTRVGQVEPPGGTSGPPISVEAALAELDDASEEKIDQVLAQIKVRENAARLAAQGRR